MKASLNPCNPWAKFFKQRQYLQGFEKNNVKYQFLIW